ncbi:MAG: SAM-dependent methyltransferase [Deltaproteobacteria bacterium]|nr:SAM-dependent methyltransferase [Deltaproteobacteria bacterium]MBZ0220606.1 SAM-dependent methyltransferase [Deltaproteobacteria bacterium]
MREAGPLPETGLAREIAAEIREKGPITFARFMEMALYLPGKGYYASDRGTWGPEGDYITSIDVSPVFARTLAKGLEEMWEALGSPAPFVFVEAGAGRGWLTRGVLESLKEISPGLSGVITPRLVERSGARRESPQGATWHSELSGVPPFSSGCILSNELIDSFPVHRVEFSGGELREIHVGCDGSGFTEVPGPLSTGELERYFIENGVIPFEGMRTEVNLEAMRWIGEAGKLMERGFIVTIDYGHPATELYSPDRRGSLMCHYRHTLNDNPFINVGEQDITTHADFTALARAGLRHGLEVTGFTTQKNYLIGLGILDELKPPPDGSPGIEEMNFNRALARLISPGGMGDTFKVLVQHKGVAKPELRAFSFRDMARSLLAGC